MEPSLKPGVVRLRTLVAIRWSAAAGQSLALAGVELGLGFPLPTLDCAAVVLAAVFVNIVSGMAKSPRAWLSEREAAAHIAFDVAQLAALLYLTGGLQNPFALLLLAPVAIVATVLGPRASVVMCGAVIAAAAVLAFVHRPLPWPAPGLDLPHTYVLGLLAALAIATVFLAEYCGRVSAEARSMAAALAAAEIELAREQRAAAVGALAAAAAHELGSPLGTIAVVAREMALDAPGAGPLADDLALIQSEIERCRAILAELAREPADAGAADPFDRPLLGALIEEVAAKWRAPELGFALARRPLDDSAEPHARRRAELLRGIGLVMQNAFQFARGRVEAELAWSAREVTLTVRDDGPGYPAGLLNRLGEPYVSGRGAARDGHLGLGLFIAQTLLASSGARLAFENAPEGGARVSAKWRRGRLEFDAPGSIV